MGKHGNTAELQDELYTFYGRKPSRLHVTAFVHAEIVVKHFGNALAKTHAHHFSRDYSAPDCAAAAAKFAFVDVATVPAQLFKNQLVTFIAHFDDFVYFLGKLTAVYVHVVTQHVYFAQRTAGQFHADKKLQSYFLRTCCCFRNAAYGVVVGDCNAVQAAFFCKVDDLRRRKYPVGFVSVYM